MRPAVTHSPHQSPIDKTHQPYHTPAFNEVAARGQIRRERVVKVIKMWYQMSLICGSDVTWVRSRCLFLCLWEGGGL